MSETVEERVMRVIVDTLRGAPGKNITPESFLAADLDADPLDVVEIIVALEEEFGIDIPEEEISLPLIGVDFVGEDSSGTEANKKKLDTVNDLIQLVKEKNS